MQYMSAGNGPLVSLTHTVAVYDPASDGRVVHLHHVVVLEGGKTVGREEVEQEALGKAREKGHDVGRLRLQYLDVPLPEGRGVLCVDAATGSAVVRTRGTAP
ncbi:hypothetical protein [Streptomyces celluloflavus]|uniref:hypothetical protein n=1 Tax=Streptomyces celluloflavus TaxID=58344 RepID=UPI00364643AE